MEGISRRELARRMDVSETTVRRHIDAGALAEAMLRDGSLHARKAVEALTRSMTNSKVVPRELIYARTRRLRVQVSKLADEVADLRATAITPEDAAAELAEQVATVEAALGAIPKAASALAGFPAAEVLRGLRNIIYAALESNTATEDEDDWWNDPVERPVDLDRLTPNALLARRIDLSAQKLEIEHALARGQLQRIEDVGAEWEERLGVCRSLLLAIPGRLAQRVEGATTSSARSMLADEVELALQSLTTKGSN